MDVEFGLLKEVEDRLGVDAAKRLAAKLGGQFISIPKESEHSALEEKVGSELAELLVELRSGEKVEVPIGHKYRKSRVRDGVLAHPELSANELARKYGVTYNRVQQIRRELQAQGLPTGQSRRRAGITRNGVIAHPELSVSELAAKFGVGEKRIKDIQRQHRKFGTKKFADCETLHG